MSYGRLAVTGWLAYPLNSNSWGSCAGFPHPVSLHGPPAVDHLAVSSVTLGLFHELPEKEQDAGVEMIQAVRT